MSLATVYNISTGKIIEFSEPRLNALAKHRTSSPACR